MNFKGKDRNKLCWCNSGKKYKKCHMGRDSREKVHPIGHIQKLRKNYSSDRKCLHYDDSDNNCNEIIGAHTVQKNGPLKSISKNGHVMKIEVAPYKSPEIKKVGINKASVFTGFCGYHDKKLFEPIENASGFDATPLNCLISGYRAFAFEKYKKEGVINSEQIMRDADLGRNVLEQYRINQFFNETFKSIKMGHEDIDYHFEKYKNAYKNNDASYLNYAVFFFNGVPEIIGTYCFTPDKNINGKKIQDFDSKDRLGIISCSTFLTKDGYCVVYSWLKEFEACSKFVLDIISLEKKSISNVISTLYFRDSENTFFSNSFKEKIEDDESFFPFVLTQAGIQSPLWYDMPDFKIILSSRECINKLHNL